MNLSAGQVMRGGVAVLVVIEVLAFWWQKQIKGEFSGEIAIGLLLTAVLAWISMEGLEIVAGRLSITAGGVGLLALMVDAVGNIWDWYNRYEWYDTVVHFVSGWAVAVISMIFFDRLRRKRGWIAVDWVWKYLAWSSAAVAGIGFEVIEFSLDYTQGMDRWLGSGGDTVIDLVLTMTGAGAGLLWVSTKKSTADVLSAVNTR